jgi:glycosyltransferase involved in cell wall biosynthesis
MKRLLYIGNYLKSKRSNVASIHVLGALLEREGYALRYSSSKHNKVLRLVDMLYACWRFRKTTDLVIIDVYSTQNFYFALLCSQLCRGLGLPYIANLNGGNLPHRLEQNPGLSQGIFRHSVTNVAPSLYLKNAFEYHGYFNVTYIPNTIELAKYPFKEREFDKPKLLWVRSFAQLYNPFMAVRVLKALQEQGYDASLCMVGPDSDGSMAEVQALASSLQVEVLITGKLSKAKWTALASDYNVFINTTHFDNTPLSVIEAMALGLAIVSTDVGGMPFLIKHEVHGLLVADGSVTAMVEAIIALLDQPKQRQEMLRQARTRIEAFDWQKVKPMWDAVICQKI